MVFSSYVFLFLFLPAILGAYYAARSLQRLGLAPAARLVSSLVLLAGSYLFYGWERYWYVSLIVFSTLVDFTCAAAMTRSTDSRIRRSLLVASIVTNLGLLGFFKYRNFALDAFRDGLGMFGFDVGAGAVLPDLVLPVGISFYTFQSMSYTIDVYRGVVPAVPVRRGLDFFCYVALFPQLVAGPIVRFRDIHDQLAERSHTLAKFGAGVFCFMLGFAKKTLIANNVGVLADSLFSTSHPGFLDAWTGMLAYALQIYFDFSGYSDMAIGLGLMFGFVFPINFDSPYRAESITDFWRRWHISLSSWLRDYLYIPLGGNRRGRILTYRNLMLTMLLGGLWHGAAWTFVFWGAWHGGLLALERMLGKRPAYAGLPRPLRVAATFLLVVIGWVLFRAEGVARAGEVFSGMAGVAGIGSFTLRGPHPATLPLIVLLIATVVTFVAPTTQKLAERITPIRAVAAWILFSLGVMQMLQSGFNPFLYFQF